MPPQPSTKTCPAASAPSIPCSGADSSWYCNPSCTCDVSRDNGCNCFGSCVPAGSGSSASSAAVSSTPESTFESSIPTAAASSVQSVQTQPSTTNVATRSSTDAESSVASVQTQASVTEISTTAAAGTSSTRTSDAWALNAGNLWASVLGIVMWFAPNFLYGR